MSKPRRTGRFLVVTGLCGLVLIALLGHRLSVTYRTTLTGCVSDNGTGGGLGLFRWAQRTGMNPRALEVPVWEAPATLENQTGNCIITMGNGAWSPLEQELETDQWLALRRWLARGNCLIVVTTAPESLPKSFRQELREAVFEGAIGEKSGFSFLHFRFRPPSVEADPTTIEVPTTGYGTLTVQANGPRWHTNTKSKTPGQSNLAADQRGGVLLRIPVDEGAVYVLLDAFAWTNAGLDRSENAQVLSNILSREVRGGVLGFDEYRHGHGRAESFLTYLWHLPGATSAFGIIVICGLLYLYGRNVRLQAIEGHEVVERRTSKEYIDAVAGLHERARAAPLAVGAVARRLRHLSRVAAQSPANVDELLRRADGYAAETGQGARTSDQRPARPTAARGLVVELIRLRKQTYGSRTIS